MVRAYLKKVGLLESIKGKLGLYFVLLIIVPFLFLGIIAYQSEKAALSERITGQLTSIADIQKSRVQSWLAERASEARFLARDEHIVQDIQMLEDHADPRRYKDTRVYTNIVSQMQAIKENHGYLDIVILDPAGKVVVSTQENELGKSRAGEAYFRNATMLQQSEHFIQDIYRDTHFGKLAIAFSVPMRAERGRGRLVGVTVVIADAATSLYPLIEGWPGMGRTGDTLVAKRVGNEVVFLNRLRYQPDSPLRLKFPVSSSPSPILNAVEGREGIMQARDYRGVMVLAAYRHIPETGWGLVIKEDLDDAFAPVRLLAYRVVLTMGFALVLVVLLIFMVSRKIAEPIISLNSLAERITKGDFGVSLPLKRKDEVGSLAGSFNTMAMSLMKYRKEAEDKKWAVEEANRQLIALAESLEEKVSERTRELEESRNRIKENLDLVERANIELRRMDRIKDHFLGMMSHELRTPLSLITGYSSNLVSDPAMKLDPRVMESVEGIYKGAERLKNLVTEMMDISQIDARGLRLVFELTDVGQVVEEVLKELGSFVSERGQTVVVGDFSGIPKVTADRKRLRQVLVNIIGNAIKFTADGGRIEVTPELHEKGTDYVTRYGKVESDYLDIMVKDEGIGIDKDEIDRIFEKFYEVGEIEKHITSKYRFLGRGVGLGLPIARGIVEAHQGRLWAESPGYDPAKRPGSVFHIFIPVVLEPGKGRGLLDVFGEPVASVPEEEYGHEGHAAVEAVPFEAVQAGAADYITKPFKPDELLVKIASLIAGAVERPGKRASM